MLEGKPQVNTIFMRDPIKDKLYRTDKKSVYLEKVGQFSGLTPKAIESEINDREKFFKKLVEKNIRSMNEVSKAAQLFLEERK